MALHIHFQEFQCFLEDHGDVQEWGCVHYHFVWHDILMMVSPMPSRAQVIRHCVMADLLEQTGDRFGRGLRKSDLAFNNNGKVVSRSKQVSMSRWNRTLKKTRRKLVALRIIPRSGVQLGQGVFGRKLLKFVKMEYKRVLPYYWRHLEYMAETAVQVGHLVLA